MDFYSLESRDGLRFSWNNFPSSKIAETRAVIPVGCLYTPLKDVENLALVEYEPLKCKSCAGILNPHCPVDFRTKAWMCPFCGNRNVFPSHYAENVSESVLPPELQQDYTTIEYSLKKLGNHSNAYLFLIDTCIEQKEMDSLKKSLLEEIQALPLDCYVGIITVNRYVFVYDLSCTDIPKCHAFKGTKDYSTPQEIYDILGIVRTTDPRGPQTPSPSIQKYMCKLSSCAEIAQRIISEISPDPWLNPPDERSQRAIGAGIAISVGILEAFSVIGSRIVSFIGGPTTIGHGNVVGLKFEENIRSLIDIEKNTPSAKYYKNAEKYYQALCTRAIRGNITLDVFGFCLDQFGLHEMKSLFEKTGGVVVQQEEFNSDVFRGSLSKFFAKDEDGGLKHGLSGKIEMIISKEIKLLGCIGPCHSLKKKANFVSDQSVGEGETCQWHLGGLEKSSTYGYYFEITAPSQGQDHPPTKMIPIQFQTIYKHSSGDTRLRVTTTLKKFADCSNNNELTQGFDQEASAAIVARLAMSKSNSLETGEVIRFLDRSLIRIASKFGSYQPDNVNSFSLGPEFQTFPQFMYYLRRSNFIQTLYTSLDETAYLRMTMSRETTNNVLVMIQPALIEYNPKEEQPKAVLSDIEAMKSDVILLVDMYFFVVIWRGSMIMKWVEAGFHEKPEYEHLRNMLEMPHQDAELIISDRTLLQPKKVVTEHNGSQERLVKSKLNPNQSARVETVESGNFFTDDASLTVFMTHLIKLAVSNAGHQNFKNISQQQFKSIIDNHFQLKLQLLREMINFIFSLDQITINKQSLCSYLQYIQNKNEFRSAYIIYLM